MVLDSDDESSSSGEEAGSEGAGSESDSGSEFSEEAESASDSDGDSSEVADSEEDEDIKPAAKRQKKASSLNHPGVLCNTMASCCCIAAHCVQLHHMPIQVTHNVLAMHPLWYDSSVSSFCGLCQS